MTNLQDIYNKLPELPTRDLSELCGYIKSMVDARGTIETKITPTMLDYDDLIANSLGFLTKDCSITTKHSGEITCWHRPTNHNYLIHKDDLIVFMYNKLSKLTKL